jgi:STE24 endopeptidase
VSSVSRSRALPIVVPVALATATAELAARALTPSERVPSPVSVRLADHFSAAEITRGRRFARPQLVLGLAASLLEAAALAELVRRRGRRGFPAGSRRPVVRSATAGAVLATGLSLPGLPLAAVARRRSLAVGLSTQSWRGWGEDLLKASGIQAAFAAGGAAGMTAVTRRWPRGWWLPAAGGSVVLGTVLAALAPLVLDPIFNDFTPLPEGETRSDVLELARDAGVRVGQVFSVDASRRTTAANAYVAGLGPSKRVVLFDTLLDRYSREEVRVVVAHELGHVRHRDVLRSAAFAALTAPAAALAVQRVSWQLTPERGTPGALPALALAAGLVSAPIGIVASRLSRAVERRADLFSLQLSDAPEAFVSFERTIALQNVADLEPPRVLSLLSTHPPTDERIGAALRYAENRRAGRPAP